MTRNGGLNEYPTCSPAGRRLAFNSHRDGQFEIYSTTLGDSRQTNLTRHPARDQWPAWSPDVFVMRADGSAVCNLTRTRTLDESHPAWMPDGRLSFTHHREIGPIELWAAAANGSNARRLATSAQPVFGYGWKPEPRR